MISPGVGTHLVALVAISWAVASAQSPKRFEGTVVVDKKQPVAVHDLQLDFRPTGAGYYDASRYGPRRAIPLDNGIIASFDRITEARFTCRRDAGRGTVVQVVLRATTGQVVEGTLAGPLGDVFLVGTTELGAFELRVDPPESRDTVVTFAARPQAAFGALRGNIVGAKTGKPLAGAAIVLCKIAQGRTCSLQANLNAVAKPDGSFQIEKIPAADYFVFHDPTGAAREAWKGIDGKEMILALGGIDPTYPNAPERKQLFGSFGCDGGITVTEGSGLQFKDGRLAGGSGSLVSEKCGLTLEFRDATPLGVNVVAETTNLVIKAWNR